MPYSTVEDKKPLSQGPVLTMNHQVETPGGRHLIPFPPCHFLHFHVTQEAVKKKQDTGLAKKVVWFFPYDGSSAA